MKSVCSLIGGPGVGKGTFAKIICARLGWKHVSLGDVLRVRAEEDTPTGRDLRILMAEGSLVSDALANRIILDTCTSSLDKGVLLDGYPRTLQQAQFFDQAYGAHRVVNVLLEEHIVVAKLLGRRICRTCGEGFNLAGIQDHTYDMPAILPNPATCKLSRCNPVLVLREDDTEQTIRRRIASHNEQSQPILDYYEKAGRLKQFRVRKGVKDVDALIETMLKS
ncbi:adenylate kinase-domain-containing protein [Ochromonadaceae sp. CCMP2298]|nr:adenylate kinase-domain-containing protein [Ochromonadaceae sp. CCMP2298]|mmetsp:Transcript_30459/g.67357  ORF Transcript_30459/g.67357 Transcript_30459/m.67357 type:complete len:222 (+) Transcript_30459:378-1043(+)|eukprot:CAMPEP_0173199056 /NCGR_PEP_ID=MMETSP1141-20130122/17022_1 /TAXON_ID=483371 /ORGANISM="non described non described, Strain CCMP2298" /LENGTH=221 /DNA_ID=CAMNT_0014123901 /DNA_START=342 /DNA_END=1007 /DNA_ORIENTATION=-